MNQSMQTVFSHSEQETEVFCLCLFQEGPGWESLSAGKNCTQEMVNMNLLRYVHTGMHGAKTYDHFVFYLLDGQNRSPAQHFHISIKDLEKGL